MSLFNIFPTLFSKGDKPNREKSDLTEHANKLLRDSLPDGFEGIKRALELEADPNLPIKNSYCSDSYPLFVVSSKEAVQLLLSAGADPNKRDFIGRVPLHYVTELELAKLLIEAGADVNAKDNDENTPLHLIEDMEIAKLLIASGANLNSINDFQQTPLHRSSSLEIANILIDNGAKLEVRDSDREMAIESILWLDGGARDAVEVIRSLELGVVNPDQLLIDHAVSPLAVKLLLNAGANVNAQDDNLTPLAMALGESIKSCEMLIQAGADVNFKRSEGFSYLHSEDKPEFMKLLIRSGADVNARWDLGQTPLHWATKIEAIKVLVDAGADVNATDYEGVPPLCHFAERRDVEAINYLLDAGADVNKKDFEGKSPLWYFIVGGQSIEAIKLLINRGADVNPNIKCEYDSESCLLDRVENDEMARLLLEAGSLPRKNTLSRGRFDNIETVARLISLGADPNESFIFVSPIHNAKSIDVISLLIAHGADVNSTDLSGQTLLHKSTDPDIVRLLIRSGADANAEDRDGNNPIETNKIVKWALHEEGL